MTSGAVRVAVHRITRDYRELLRSEVCLTLTNEDNPDQELQYLASLG